MLIIAEMLLSVLWVRLNHVIFEKRKRKELHKLKQKHSIISILVIVSIKVIANVVLR